MEIEKYYFLCFCLSRIEAARDIECSDATRVRFNGKRRFLCAEHLCRRQTGRLRAKRDPKNKLHYYLYGFQFNNFFKFISQILLSVMYIIGSWGHERCPCSMSLLIDVFMLYVIIDSRSMTGIF